MEQNSSGGIVTPVVAPGNSVATYRIDVEPDYEPAPLKNYDHQQRADASKLRAATSREPAVGFADGVRRVREPYR